MKGGVYGGGFHMYVLVHTVHVLYIQHILASVLNFLIIVYYFHLNPPSMMMNLKGFLTWS